MSKKFLRVYQELDPSEVKPHLLIYGEISGNCASCSCVDIKLDTDHCPECGTEFQYISFRSIKSHRPKLAKLKAQRPKIVFIDYEDYKHQLASLNAHEFLK